ncbi:HET-domain-containing protein [Trematosphaeria pertusa]|uniref:HET-domain-containing protein n=1 Tax=Trematosphaeria pertusa TaxID=390896 RepID=A0A6A6ILM4_9PLEO|nr:HET-domain-containing protein [Trematosphaeria pertusa]KAF2250968.1 HET-domain-containing protein [Trematosphaeria pertusa]
MRLIDVDTIEIKTFGERDVPEYAILSHTWGADEVTFQELTWINRVRAVRSMPETQDSQATINGHLDGSATVVLAAMEMLVKGTWNPGTGLPDISDEALMGRYGYAKIVNSARTAKELGYRWLWCDTCCIDKTSSAELQEAINSMFRWYNESAVCLVYLNDIPPESAIFDTQATSEVASNAFTKCRWITRGWTLQELVAPSSVRFYYQDWTLMGDKGEFIEELSNATGIPIFVLENGDLSEVSLAERMSWACYRQTTRIEDMAYCLLGIFDIQMPMLYGEGEKAFIRLQEEILKTTDDYSLFAWRAVNSEKSIYRGLLARSPLEFRDCGSIERESNPSTFPIHSTPIGLGVQLEFLAVPRDKSRFLAMIRCSNHMNQRLAIHLKRLDDANQYARVDAGTLVPIDNWPTGQLRIIYVRQKVSILHDFYTPEMRCFHVQRRVTDRSIPPVRITGAFPPENWNQEKHELCIPETSKQCYGVLFLRGQSSSYGYSTNFQVVVGFDRSSKHYWCKAVEHNWPDPSVDHARWRSVIQRMVPEATRDPLLKHDMKHDIFVIGDSGLGVNVSIRGGLCGDSVALQVLVDGLLKGR